MQPVKIKSINKLYMDKSFVLKGRVKYLTVEPNRNSSGSHLNAIIFDDSSEIEIVAFENCENISKLLKVNNVVTIENGILREVNKDYKKTKHKYQIILEYDSIIKIIKNNEVNNGDFPIHKYTSATKLITLTTGMIIDVVGVCCQLDIEKTFDAQNRPIRNGKILIDSKLLIEVKFYGDKGDVLYNVGSTLSLISAKYINFKGYKYLVVENSSYVKVNQQQLLNYVDMNQQLEQLEKIKKICQDLNFTIEFPEQRLSTSSISSITQPNKISGLKNESVDQKPSTSCSAPSNKRKTQDFEGELFPQARSKILKTKKPEPESFSDERFIEMVINFMQSVSNNKNVNIIRLRIVEFISKMLIEYKNSESK